MSDMLIVSFGMTVRRQREARGWSQEQLAGQADLNRSYVGEIERGQVTASLVTLQKLAAALGLASGDLLRLSEQQHQAQQAKAIRLTAIVCCAKAGNLHPGDSGNQSGISTSS